MLRKLKAEYSYRTGRRQKDAKKLSRAATLDRYNIRAAIELARMGSPSAISSSLLLTLAGLRDYAIQHPLDAEASEFLQLAIRELHRSRGQYFQDIAALLFSGSKQAGFFIEIGTGDGESLSNTFLLEKHFGWHGILFEPDRRFHESIARLRTATLDTRPVFSCDDQVMSFLEVTKAGELSTLSNYRREDGRFRYGSCHEVRTTTLNSALTFHNAPTVIDYISIDTEGSEMAVLEGIDFRKYDVRFLTIEHNFVPGKKESLAEFLAPFGYRSVLPEFSAQDIWLVKSAE